MVSCWKCSRCLTVSPVLMAMYWWIYGVNEYNV